ncbi:MAG: hypothetical protein O3A01_07470 [bacterium]|nr:hypothetical protein [bacterium]
MDRLNSANQNQSTHQPSSAKSGSEDVLNTGSIDSEISPATLKKVSDSGKTAKAASLLKQSRPSQPQQATPATVSLDHVLSNDSRSMPSRASRATGLANEIGITAPMGGPSQHVDATKSAVWDRVSATIQKQG